MCYIGFSYVESSNTNKSMDQGNISALAELLRKTGDKVLRGEKKLLLSDTLLKRLQDSFKYLTEEEDCDTSFLVTKTNNSKVAVFHDIQFLHDFIQKVVNVSISKENKKFCAEELIDISKFKSLRILELREIPIQNVCGIQHVRTQLQSVICVHSVQQLQDILINCGADHSRALLWEGLNEGVFSYNALEAVDSSLLYTPMLQIIDLSHNRLKSFTVENCLPNLKYLNLSYNLLQSVPKLGKEASCKLKTLLLRNNYLQNLVGLEKLKALIHLDISCNSLCDHNVLVSLERLPLLTLLNVVGNPLSFHVQHRFRTVLHLHLNSAISRFMLDNHPLSRQEKKAVLHGNRQRETKSDEEITLDSSLNSESSGCWDQIHQQDEQHETDSVVHIHTKRILRTKRQRQFVKEAVIAESPEAQEKNRKELPPGDRQHLEVKRHVEELRQRFGEEHWLSEHGASQLQAVLGLPVPPPPLLPTFSPDTRNVPQIFTQNSSSPSKLQDSVMSQPIPETKTAFSTVISHQTLPEQHEVLRKSWEIEKEDVQEYHSHSAEHSEEEKEDDEDVDEGKLFTVRNNSMPSEMLLLLVGTRQLLERDVRSGRVLQRWDLSALQSCEFLSEDTPTVRLTFNALRRDRRSRTYLVDPSDAKALTHLLGDVLASRSLSEMNQVAYRCMKCSTQFSQEEDLRFPSKGQTVLCPSCSSSIVCMMEEVPVPTRTDMKSQSPVSASPSLATQLPQHLGLSLSSSQSSIGSRNRSSTSAAPVGTSDCCLQVAAIVHQVDAPCASPPRLSPPLASHFASALELERSAASLESESIISALSTRRCDSDIEVISNPSQSSIEVLEGETRTPCRKRSSEEQQPAVVPQEVNVKTLPTPALQSVGLTESSSSGSLTDSICTTYETQRNIANGSVPEEQSLRLQNNASNHSSKNYADKPVTEIEDDNSFYGTDPIPTLQEMFEGLLEKVDKKLATCAELKPVTSMMDNLVHYSYSDFQQVDHRLRLFFLQELLESDAEELLLVLRADVLKPGIGRPFPGLLVFSSFHVWLLQVTGIEGDNPESWLQRNLKLSLSAVSALFPLPWAQGVGMQCREPERYLLMLLQDCQRTQNFLDAADSILPASCGVKHEPASYHSCFIKKLTLTGSGCEEQDVKLQHVSLFTSFNIKEQQECAVTNGVVVIRTSDLLVVDSDLSWLSPITRDDTSVKTIAAQQISNLMEVRTAGCHVELHFMDETKNQDEVWDFNFQTPECVQALVVYVQAPWENLFSVPLQVVDMNQK